jgi:hypothetical protein
MKQELVNRNSKRPVKLRMLARQHPACEAIAGSADRRRKAHESRITIHESLLQQ